MTIQLSLAAIRTTGLTPQDAIAATASCMALSTGFQCPADADMVQCDKEPMIVLPSMFPCSVSTKTKSKPQRAMVLARLLPGSICQLQTNQLEAQFLSKAHTDAPKHRPDALPSPFFSRLAACILKGFADILRIEQASYTLCAARFSCRNADDSQGMGYLAP